MGRASTGKRERTGANRRPEPAPPAWVEPQLTRLAEAAPEGEQWAHEIKYDGYRMHARIADGRLKLITRSGLDWTDKYAGIAEALAKLPVRSAYIDGELCGVRANGVTAFSLIQAATDEKSSRGLVYFAFDLLFLDGEDVSALPLLERKERLRRILDKAPAGIQYSDHIVGEGPRFLAQACKLGLEGVISKRIDRSYAPNNRGLWVKTKCLNREEFVVVGWTDPEGARAALGALLLAYWTPDGRLVYAGRAGTGMNDKDLRRIRAKLEPLAIDRAPLDVLPSRTSRFGSPLVLSRVHWVEPKLAAEVTYLTWTDDNLLRHVVFLGLREDKRARDIVTSPPHEHPAPPLKTPAPAPRRARPRGKLAVPDENILQLLPDAVTPSKEELKAYWRRVGARALPYLGHRPLKLVRHEKGITFYHRGPLPPLPDSVHALQMKKSKGGEGVRVWIDSLDGFLGLVDIGAVELHPWNARVENIEMADQFVFDLDPGPGAPWSLVLETAFALRDMLRAEGLKPWPKLTGGKGVHLVAPAPEPVTHAKAHEWCRRIAARMAAKAPDLYTTTAAHEARAGKLFIDYLRNGRGTTAVGVYSPRARPGFPVVAKTTWRQLENGIMPDAFNMAHSPRS